MIRLFIISLLFLMPLTAISQPPSLQNGVSDHKESNNPRSTSKDNQNISHPVTSISYKNPHAALQTKETCTCTRNAAQQPEIASSFFSRLTHDITGTATIFLTLVTLALVCVTLYQSTLLRRELILTQRPILRVSTVIISMGRIAWRETRVVCNWKTCQCSILYLQCWRYACNNYQYWLLET